MNCDWVSEKLDDYVDGELSAPDFEAVRLHVEGCESCRAQLHSLRSLLAAAADLPRRTEPARDLWSGIEPRLDRASIVDWRRHARNAVFAAAIAAMVVMAVSVGLLRGPRMPYAPLTSLHDVQPDQGEPFKNDRVVLREAYYARSKTLDPHIRSVIESNLSIIDQSLDEIRSAMELAPDNPRLEEMLVTACLTEVEMLRQAVRASAEG